LIAGFSMIWVASFQTAYSFLFAIGLLPCCKPLGQRI
jgi:hypothetical protein